MRRTSKLVPFLLACAVLVPREAASCEARHGDLRFDAVDCLELRKSSTPGEPGETLLINRCPSPIALLVVVCDLAVRPACKSDPVASTGWSAIRGVEYLAPAGAELRPSAPGLQRGWRAQIAACRLAALPSHGAPSVVSHDPCAMRLEALKSSLQASGGRSMHSVVRWQRAGCST